MTLKKENKNKLDRILMAITYSRILPNISGIIRKRQPLLKKTDRLKTIFPSPYMVAFRRRKSIEDLLVYEKLSRLENKNGTSPCGKKCAICDLMNTSDIFDRSCGEIYKSKGSINCNGRNVIYGIKCTKCD